VSWPISRHPPPYGSLQALATSTGFNLIVKWTLTPFIVKTPLDNDNQAAFLRPGRVKFCK
jgi:hypothetical protein